jgi:hypothetical protein
MQVKGEFPTTPDIDEKSSEMFLEERNIKICLTLF